MSGISAHLFKPNPLKKAAMTKAMQDAANKAAKDMAKDMTIITKGWSDGGLKFVGKVQSGRRERWEITALPENPNSKRADIFMFLDEGTGLWGPKHAEYPIEPKKKGGKLRFTSGYKAGSRPNKLSTTSSSRFGDTVCRDKVIHPGIQPRNWTKLRLAKWKKKLPEYFQDGMSAAVKASGHAYKRK